MYDGFADDFEAHASDGPWNAHYDRPAVLDLCGEVDGRRVLDAGCGPGLYGEQLIARGARCQGFDVSADMVRVARRRLGDGVPVRVHDLEHSLAWVADGSVDLVVCALALHHVEDRVGALSEFRRALSPTGRVVVSTSHPTADWLQGGGSYFQARHLEQMWPSGLHVRWWHQPLDATLDEFSAAGLRLDRLVEVRPVPGMADRHPEQYATLSARPWFIAFRLLAAPA